MATTPHKPGVRWALDVSMSDFGSPFSAASSASEFSSSSLQYLNSQLVAHGFAPSPGLSLEGLSTHDTERVVKCLTGMLGQRMEDMSRTEELSAKYRTLSYDHERLLGMHRTAKEQAANAEREMNVFKSRLTAVQKALQASETAHKHTTAELTRTRTSMQALRQTHQAEIKKRETQYERMTDRWSKLSDMQGQLGKTASGLTFKCGNAEVMEGSSGGVGRGNKNFMEVALEEAEETRARLDADNLRLRRMVVNSVNEMQALLHRIRGEDEDESEMCTVSSLFPLHPKTAASDKLSRLMSSFEDAVAGASQEATSSTSTSASSPTPTHLEEEIKHLNGIIDKLRSELDQAHKDSLDAASKSQDLFEQLSAARKDIETQHDFGLDRRGDVLNTSIDAPDRDAEQERLDSMKRELDEERRKFTEAAVKLGKERVALEADRLQFLEERRSWHVEKVLNELPPTPQPQASATTGTSPKKSSNSPRKAKSPRKSPAKTQAHNANSTSTGSSPRKTRMARRSSVGLTPPPLKKVKAKGSGLGNGEGRGRIEYSAETEVIPSFQTMLAPPVVGSGIGSSSLLPTTFVLPPPSPNALLPVAPAIAPALEPMAIDSPDSLLGVSPPMSTASSSLESSSNNPVLTTPSNDPFAPSDIPDSESAPSFPYPVAKPFAKRMIHAYSPAKPSPLSRILMLGDSPGSPDGELDFGLGLGGALGSGSSGQLGVVTEEEEIEEEEMFPRLAPEEEEQEWQQDVETVGFGKRPEMSLAAELGVGESDDDDSDDTERGDGGRESPLKKMRLDSVQLKKSSKPTGPPPSGPYRAPGKTKASTPALSGKGTSSRKVVEKEKENKVTETTKLRTMKDKKRSQPSSTSEPERPTKVVKVTRSTVGSAGSKVATTNPTKPSSSSSSSAAPSTAKTGNKPSTSRGGSSGKAAAPPSSNRVTGGPRRVLIDSAEAPPLVRGRKA